MPKTLPVLYDCLNCTAYCCTYGHIAVAKQDLRRLAKHFGIDRETAKKRFTKKDGEGGRVLRHRFDPYFQSACLFLDQETRRCTVHEARPSTCRAYPGAERCEYYDFLQAERARQDEPGMYVAAYPAEIVED